MLKLDVLAAELNLWANETEQIYRATKEIKYRGDAKHLRYLAATLNQSSLPSTGVTSFNTRVGDVLLSSLDVTTALGYNPVTQARTLTINGVTYDLSANRSWTISTAIPTLAQVTTAGNTTTNAITVGALNVNVSGVNRVILGTGQIEIYDAGNVRRFFAGQSGINGQLLIDSGGTWDVNLTGGGFKYLRTGNFAIGTTTDTGYKLDVNGTARVTDNAFFNKNITVGSTTAGTDNSISLLGASNGFFRVRSLSGAVFLGLGDTLNGSQGNMFGLTRSYLNEYGNTVNGIMSTDNIPYSIRFGAFGSSTEALRITTSQITSYLKFVTTGSITASAALAQGVYFNNTLVAAANNDVLVGLDINPTFTNGAFTGVSNYGIRLQNSRLALFDAPIYSQAGASGFNTGFSITGTAGSDYTIYSSRNFIFNTGQSMYFNTDTDAGDATQRAWYFAGARSGTTGGRTYTAITVDGSGFPSLTIYNNDNGSRIQLNSNAASYFNGGNLLVGTTTDAG
ncbi:MAG: hypothetical protein ACOVOV_11810, partial [Dolichospermum sp.]